MKNVETRCDHCGVKLNGNIDYCEMHIALNHIGVETDLCHDCFKALRGYVVRYVKREAQRIVKVCEEGSER